MSRTAAQDLARRISELERRLRAVERGAQLEFASYVDGDGTTVTATASLGALAPAKDAFVVADPTVLDYTLAYLPVESSVNLSLNGVELREGLEFVVDYTTGVASITSLVTLSASPTPADVITADYWTLGTTSPVPGTPTTGGVVLSDAFTGAAATVDGRSADVGGPWAAIDGGMSVDGVGVLHVSTWGSRDNGVYAAAVAECGVADVSIVATIDSFGSWASDGGQLMLIFRCVDQDTWMGLEVPPSGSGRATSINRNLFEGTGYVDYSAGTFGTVAWVAGDVVRLDLAGTVATLYRNGTLVGSYDFGPDLLDIHGIAAFATATQHGLGGHAGYSNFTMGWGDVVVTAL